MIIRPQRVAAIVYAASILCCFPPRAAWAADDSSSEIRAVVDTAIRPLMAEYDIPGMALAVTVDGQPIFINYGVASREHKTPVSETTLFELGSLTKVFTGTLATYAQELGQLSLNDRPSKYMPELEGSAIDEASLLNLGTYTAGGLPLQFPEEVADTEQMIGFFRQWRPDAAPGTLRRYSNPSIGLLGYISGLAMKVSFAEAVETELLLRLDLRNTYIRVPEAAMAAYAWGYDTANDAVRVNPGVLAEEAYGAKSTAADMISFVHANIDPSRLHAPLRRAVNGSHIGFFKVGPMVQGLGWEQYPYPVTLERLLAGNSRTTIWDPNPAKQLVPVVPSSRATLYNKTGSTNGFGAYVAFVPEEKIGIVMLANKNFPIPARIKAAHAILGRLAEAK